MAINEQPIEFEYIADGNTTVFPFSCRVIYETDLIVQVNSVQVFNFTIRGLNNPEGGSVVFDTPPAKDSIVLIAREIKLVRETEYQQNGDFLAPTVNNDFDRIWMALQGAAGWFKRALRYPLGGKNYDAENRRIINLADPINPQDAATKNYVDTGDARLEGIVNELSGNIIQDWIIVKSFQNGATLTLKNQILLNETDGRYYRWLGRYPKIVLSNSTPETTGGFGEKAWALVTIDDTQYLPITGGNVLGDLGVLGNLTAKENTDVEKDLTVGGNVVFKKTLDVDEGITTSGLKSLAYVSSENDQNSDLRLLKATGDKSGYFIRRFADDLYIYKAENGVATDKILQYTKNTDTLDFNTAGLTKSGMPVVIENQFDNKLEENGYQYLPGGLLMQWGTVDYPNYPGEKDVTVTFPIPFPSFCLNAQGIRKTLPNSGSAADGGVLLVSVAKESAIYNVQLFNPDGTPGGVRGFSWFAIGY